MPGFTVMVDSVKSGRSEASGSRSDPALAQPSVTNAPARVSARVSRGADLGVVRRDIPERYAWDAASADPRLLKGDIIEYANGLQAIRMIGYAIVTIGNRETTDEWPSPNPATTSC